MTRRQPWSDGPAWRSDKHESRSGRTKCKLYPWPEKVDEKAKWTPSQDSHKVAMTGARRQQRSGNSGRMNGKKSRSKENASEEPVNVRLNRSRLWLVRTKLKAWSACVRLCRNVHSRQFQPSRICVDRCPWSRDEIYVLVFFHVSEAAALTSCCLWSFQCVFEHGVPQVS